ncbi:MAG TPA: SAM-dependent chlorinase/fluorinase [Bacteroidales bacterium]|nr:SAM-dependent chlorinase/fluorinase [Bacteroidales bacterium]
MAIVTLTSDWGLTDHYVAAVKGAILSASPGTTIVDITHSITKYSLAETAYIIRNAYKNFPQGTIHIVGVNSDETKGSSHIIVFYDGHYFIGADNGIFSLLCETKPGKIIKISNLPAPKYKTFPSLDIYAPAACHLIEGKDAERLGESGSELFKLSSYLPINEPNAIKGIVIYFDSYDNAITNISEKIFNEVGNGRKFTAFFRNEEQREIKNTYSEVADGEIVLVFGTTGLLEIALSKGSARNLLGLNIYDPIRFEFEE